MQVAALIGDVVGSRAATDRLGLQQQLLDVLDSVSRRFGTELAVTLGDEFQGRYSSLEAAVAASWYLHLGTLGKMDLRIGVGWGEITVEGDEDSPFGQDGPAWWRARDAIEAVANPSHPVRTMVITTTDWDDLMNAHLRLRDVHIDMMDDVDAAILLGLADGETQRSLASRLGLHESSVSRRVKRHLLTTLSASATPDIPEFRP